MRTTSKLTVRGVETAKPGLHSDGGGLYLLVTETGRRRWTYIFRRGTKRTELGLGVYPDVSLADARELANKKRKAINAGADPLEKNKTVKREARQKQVPTFAEAADMFVDTMAPQFRNPKHVDQWRVTLSTHSAAIAKLRIDKIDTPEVLSVLKPLWPKIPETASRLRGRIERVLDYAKVRGWRSGENPARWRGHLDHVLPKRAKLTRGHHAAMPFEEVPAFVAKVREIETLGAMALEFTILTASRTSEVLKAEWKEFDLDKAVWTIPAVRMKAGREHRIPLSARAVAILRNLAEVRLSDFVFPGMKANQPVSGMVMTMVLRRMELTDITVHGFRSAFRDWTAECTEFPNEVCEAALAHVINNKAEAAYRRGDLFEKRRKLMDEWGAHCDGSLPSSDS